MFKTLLGKVSVHSLLLLLTCLVLLFIVPLFPREWQSLLYAISHIVLLITSTLMIEKKKKNYVVVVSILIGLLSASKIMHWHLLEVISGELAVFFFIAVTLILIKQVLHKKPGLEMILQAIGGFLVFGIAMVFVMNALVAFVPNSFTIAGVPMTASPGQFSDQSYFVFITYTTVGYGDIVPMNDISRTFAKFVALSGQIYNSVIVAILVGKYLMVEQSKMG
jgi:voltage-gated potassium channel